MISFLLIVVAVVFLNRQLATLAVASVAGQPTTHKSLPQLTQLVLYADRLYGEKKWLAAEKAYLKVLKQDHKNAAAYGHLGIIYSTQKNLPDAIECFEIAARLKPSGSTYQNLALGYYENHNYMKAIAAFDKAIMFEPTATRYIGLSKAYKRITNVDQMIMALEKASELDPSARILHLLAAAYQDNGRRSESIAVYRRLHLLDPSDADVARMIGIHLPERSSTVTST